MSRSGVERTAASVLGGLACAFALAACDQQKAAAPPPPAPPAVTVMRAASEPVSPLSVFSGRIEAVERVELRARVEGFLEKRNFTEGGEVQEGDLLFIIEKATYQAEVAQQTARVARAESSLNLANVELWRAKTLFQQKVVAQTRVDEAQSTYNVARADHIAAQAALSKAKLDLSYTEVRAPVSGRIGRSSISVGNFVGPSSGVLATLVSQTTMYVVFPVSQRELLQVRQEAAKSGHNPTAIKTRIRLADGQIYSQTGIINFVDVQVDGGTDTVIVRAEMPNPDRLLIDGQLVTALVETREPEILPVIPQQAIQADQQGAFVLVVDSEKKAQLRRISLGQNLSGGRVAIRSGLSDQDRIITEGVQRVRLNQVVDPAEAANSRPASEARG